MEFSVDGIPHYIVQNEEEKLPELKEKILLYALCKNLKEFAERY